MAFNVWLVGFKMVRGFGSLLLGAGFVLAISAGSASAHFQVLYRFNGDSDGISASALIMDEAGNFYGTTKRGGGAGNGTVFKLAPDGTKTTLFDFSEPDSGAAPQASLLRDSAGNLYGTTALTNAGESGGTVFKLSPDGHETVLHRFTTNDPAGYAPLAELIADKEGKLYGTTAFGINPRCGCGAVFKLALDGTMTVLHAFVGGSDGGHPEAGLVADKNGNLYGTTMGEGLYGSGTVFRIGADGTMTTLHSFNYTIDGADPLGTLIIGKDGNLYGTTFDGGPEWNGGVVFKMTPDGTETVLYNFGLGFRDGQNPMGALVMDRRGNLYGTTSAYGWIGNGTVFRVAPDGHEKTVRWFTTLVAHHVYPRVGGVHDGYSPSTGLTRDAAGNLYGTTSMGGDYKKGNGGTIFAIGR